MLLSDGAPAEDPDWNWIQSESEESDEESDIPIDVQELKVHVVIFSIVTISYEYILQKDLQQDIDGMYDAPSPTASSRVM
jgi:hypothetical protein